jgi:hypothetical protein
MTVTEAELDYYRKNTLSKLKTSETDFCTFYGVGNLEEYLEKYKNGMIRNYLSDQYSINSRYVMSLIFEVLRKIPLYDLEQILKENTVIKQVDSSECYSAEKVKWVILLYKPEFVNRSKKFGMFTIAHELAHRRLRHKPILSNNVDNPNMQEDEADKLAIQWGFKPPKDWLKHIKRKNKKS